MSLVNDLQGDIENLEAKVETLEAELERVKAERERLGQRYQDAWRALEGVATWLGMDTCGLAEDPSSAANPLDAERAAHEKTKKDRNTWWDAKEAEIKAHAETRARLEEELLTVYRARDVFRAQVEKLSGLLARAVKYAHEDGMRTPGVTRLARVLAEAGSALAETAPKDGER